MFVESKHVPKTRIDDDEPPKPCVRIAHQLNPIEIAYYSALQAGLYTGLGHKREVLIHHTLRKDLVPSTGPYASDSMNTKTREKTAMPNDATNALRKLDSISTLQVKYSQAPGFCSLSKYFEKEHHVQLCTCTLWPRGLCHGQIIVFVLPGVHSDNLDN